MRTETELEKWIESVHDDWGLTASDHVLIREGFLKAIEVAMQYFEAQKDKAEGFSARLVIRHLKNYAGTK